MSQVCEARVYDVITQWTKGEFPRVVGSVRALTPALALLEAKEVYTRRERCFRLSVVPHEAMLSTTEDDQVLFDLAFKKEYRQPGTLSKRNLPRLQGQKSGGV